LEGRTVIEYPTLIFGSIENTQKLHFRVVALQDTEEGAVRMDGDNPEGEGEGEKSVGLTQPPSFASSFPSSSSSNKKRGAGEGGGEGEKINEGREGGLAGAVKRVRISGEQAGSGIVEREDTHTKNGILAMDPALEGEGVEEEEDEEEEDADAEEVFLSALKEFEGKDIEALKAFIHSSES
jgi:hypothetical protein